MGRLKGWIFPGLFLLILGGTIGALYLSQEDTLRKEIDQRMGDLRQVKSHFDEVQADLTAARTEMFFPRPQPLTPGERKTLQARIEKDQADINVISVRMLDDISFLQGNDNALTQADRDYLRLVRQWLGTMTGKP